MGVQVSLRVMERINTYNNNGIVMFSIPGMKIIFVYGITFKYSWFKTVHSNLSPVVFYSSSLVV